MARGGKKLELVITGNARGALTSLADLDRAAGTTGTKVGGAGARIGTVMAGITAAVGAAAIGVGAALYAIGNSFDSAYDGIRVGTGATGEVLAGLQDSFRNVVSTVPTDFASASAAVGDLNTRLGLTGKPLEEMSTQFLELSRLTGTDVSQNIMSATQVFGAFEVAAEDQSAALDVLFRAYQATGVGVAQIADEARSASAPLRTLGFGFEDSVSMLAQFSKAGVNSGTVLAGLRQGVKNLALDGEDIPETFRRILNEIQELGPGAEATALSFELFGTRAGTDLADAIQVGAFDLDQMYAMVADGSDTIMAASEDTRDFGEELTIFKNKALLALEPVAMAVFKGIGDAFAWLAPKGEELLNQLQPHLERLAGWFEARIPDAIAWLQSKAEELLPVAQEVFGGVVAAVEDNWPQIRDTAVEVFEGIAEVVDNVVETVTVLWERFGDDLLAGAATRLSAIVQQFRGAFNFFAGLVNTVTSLIRGDWSGMWDGIKQTFGGAVDFILGWAKNLWSIFGGLFRMGGELLGGIWFGLWHGIRDFFVGTWNALYSVAAGGWNTFVGTWRMVLGALSAAWSATWGGIKDAAAAIWSAIVTVVRGQMNAVTGAVRVGVSAISNVWNGLKGAFSGVLNWVIDNVINRFISAVNRVAGAIGLGQLLSPLGNVATGATSALGAEERRMYHTGGEVHGGRGREVDARLLGGEGVLPIGVMDRMSPAQFELLRQGRITEAFGDGFGFSTITNTLKSAAGAVVDGVRHVVAQVARPMVTAALDRLSDIAPGVPGRLFAGGARLVGNKVLDWIAGVDDIAKTVAPTLAPGVGYRAMFDALQKRFPWARLISGLRPGAITATGNPSMHGKGRAVDVNPSMEIFDWIVSSYGSQSHEVIFSPAGGRQLYRGRPHMYGGVTRDMHWDHVHWSMAAGGAGTVRRPTSFLLGDGGEPEDFLAVPHSKGGIDFAGGSGGDVHVHQRIDLSGAIFVGSDEAALLDAIEKAAAKGAQFGPSTKKAMASR